MQNDQLQKAKVELSDAQELEPTDATNATDAKLLEQVVMQERVVVRHVEKNDYETAINYLDQILFECVASQEHVIKKIEYQLRSSKVAEAVAYSLQVSTTPHFKHAVNIQAWRGRVLFYSGNEPLAIKHLKAALELDPDNAMIQKSLKHIKASTVLKEKATELFKKGDIQAAIDKFGECIELDELNVHYNAVIYFNMALGLAKQKKNEESLKCLNKAVNLNPKYGKAFVKRGEINQLLDNQEDALKDFQTAQQIDPSKWLCYSLFVQTNSMSRIR